MPLNLAGFRERHRGPVWALLEAAEVTDPDYGLMWFGDVVRQITDEAEEILRSLPELLQ